MIPWAVTSLVLGYTRLGICLQLIYIIITVVRNYVEPKIVGAQLELHPIITLTSMFIGLWLFGFWGLFGTPVAISKMLVDNTLTIAHKGLAGDTAYTLTIPTLVRAPWLFCTVPAATKAEAVKNTVLGPVSETCPASILRTRPNAVLFCDPDSGRYLV
jgi:hypothetical protein